jgi:dihydrofolate reductase
MRKIIGAINMTIDGFCDHTAIDPDKEIHQHYANLITEADVILYGRITFQLMQFWQDLVKKPSGERSMDDFAEAMDKIPKIVFSNTLKTTDWYSAEISDKPLEESVAELRKQPGQNILVGSRSLIIQLMRLNLIDELQLCVHPVIAGTGLPLFENINNRKILKLIKTRTFNSGAVILYYQPQRF